MGTILLGLLTTWGIVSTYKLRQARILMMTDPLTRTYNRRWLEGRDTNKNVHTSVVYFDMDNFKIINDTKGHAAGDRALQYLVDTIKLYARNTDTVVRLGGDEFLLICPGAFPFNVGRLLTSIQTDLDKVGLSVTVGIGGMHKKHRLNLKTLIEEAELNMRLAKDIHRRKAHG